MAIDMRILVMMWVYFLGVDRCSDRWYKDATEGSEVVQLFSGRVGALSVTTVV